ncbi:hypothetical protein EDB81DRAFT_152676 [Dactylonectria macrodidyma]|uniref:Uncharacterized protein n=1 Tax=Dactylonectria macrodidyma TaxID=307937 RepID=A0A9P9JGX7_9HYPO|nr:hypothetical protein EDB81DRAFT_152676 [Dactylonectria macrodidyma]
MSVELEITDAWRTSNGLQRGKLPSYVRVRHLVRIVVSFAMPASVGCLSLAWCLSLVRDSLKDDGDHDPISTMQVEGGKPVPLASVRSSVLRGSPPSRSGLGVPYQRPWCEVDQRHGDCGLGFWSVAVCPRMCRDALGRLPIVLDRRGGDFGPLDKSGFSTGWNLGGRLRFAPSRLKLFTQLKCLPSAWLSQGSEIKPVAESPSCHRQL